MTAECNGSGEFGDDVDVVQTSDTGKPMLFFLSVWSKLSYRGKIYYLLYFFIILN